MNTVLIDSEEYIECIAQTSPVDEYYVVKSDGLWEIHYKDKIVCFINNEECANTIVDSLNEK